MKAAGYILLLALLFAISAVSGCSRPASPPPSPTTASPAPAKSPGPEQAAKPPDYQPAETQEEQTSRQLMEQNREHWQTVNAMLQKLLADIGQTRELAPPEEAELVVVTADWARENWGEGYVRDNARKIQIDERIFKGLFILPDAVSLADLYAEWPLSYLVAKLEDKVYAVQENFGRLNGEEARKALAHEVVHLLQGKHFHGPEPATYDEGKAWSALVEGDADFTRNRYLERTAGTEPAPKLDRIYENNLPPAPQAERPPALTRLLYFPYEYGEAFVSALYQETGWQAVNGAYLRPPLTTEQVLHPEKYLSPEGPLSIKPVPVNVPGWRMERSDRLGEHFIRTMLETWLPRAEAASAASGWGGDALDYFEQAGAYLFTWQTAWDSRQDASEFHESFQRLLPAAGAAILGDGLWLAGGNYIWVGERDTREVLVIVSEQKSAVDAILAAR
ncbi:MAG: hypothetical protein HY530_01255 [Chloroflexi bacterium]|nr:hypothetical protein [Chloroflexota bacterium]